MAFVSVNVTLSGATQLSATRTPCEQIIIHNPTGNAAIRVGDSGVSATEGIPVAANATLTLGSFIGGKVDLTEVYLHGTDAEVVRVAYVPF